MSHSALRLWLGFAVLGAVIGCVDGPFARANPYDPKAPLEMRIEMSADTLQGIGALGEFMLVTTPAFPLYAPYWTTSHEQFLEHLGNGIFRVRAVPALPVTVTVTASFENRRASTSVVVVP